MTHGTRCGGGSTGIRSAGPPESHGHAGSAGSGQHRAHQLRLEADRVGALGGRNDGARAADNQPRISDELKRITWSTVGEPHSHRAECDDGTVRLGNRFHMTRTAFAVETSSTEAGHPRQKPIEVDAGDEEPPDEEPTFSRRPRRTPGPGHESRENSEWRRVRDTRWIQRLQGW